jgi:hypothetical protein
VDQVAVELDDEVEYQGEHHPHGAPAGASLKETMWLRLLNTPRSSSSMPTMNSRKIAKNMNSLDSMLFRI